VPGEGSTIGVVVSVGIFVTVKGVSIKLGVLDEIDICISVDVYVGVIVVYVGIAIRLGTTHILAKNKMTTIPVKPAILKIRLLLTVTFFSAVENL